MLSYRQVKALRDAPLARDIDVLTEELYEAHLLIDSQLEYIMWLQAGINPDVYSSTEAKLDLWCPEKKRHNPKEEWK